MDNIKYERVTSKSFDMAVESLIESLKVQGFGFIRKLNFKEMFNSKGIVFDNNFLILEACNSAMASATLKAHMDVGYFMPCKLAVYEDAGKVVIGMISLEAQIGMLGHGDLNSMAKEIQDRMNSAIDASV
jgi:uncharacterized protein (DUF302 family)